MADRIRYYALVLDDRPATNPYSVFREVHAPDDYRLDVWDRALGEWQLQMSLARYTLNGEIGAVEISKAEADRIIKPRPTFPGPRPRDRQPR